METMTYSERQLGQDVFQIVWSGDMWRLTVHPEPPPVLVEEVEGSRRCRQCRQWKALEAFSKRCARGCSCRRWSHRRWACVSCMNRYLRDYKRKRVEEAGGPAVRRRGRPRREMEATSVTRSLQSTQGLTHDISGVHGF
jgi:hypothetical protein